MKLFTSLVVLGLACASLSAPNLDSNLLKTLKTQKNADVLISFKNADVNNIRNRAVAKARSLAGSRTAIIQSMFDALTAHADATQANVLNLLSKQRTAGQKVIPLWITNQIGVKGADMHLISQLSTMEEISEIIEAPRGGLIQPVSFKEVPQSQVQAGEPWGIVAIEAPAVWAQGFEGEGVTIGSIDTGVRSTHESLRQAYRSDHGWYDSIEGYVTPVDLNGHGTHTIGTILGSTNGIGVAPKAKFISCKATDSNGYGSTIDFIACGQFVVCPHLPSGPRDDPRCDLAPVAVSNSWGFTDDNVFFDQVLDTWVAAGIAPIFGAGNEGTECSTLRAPGSSLKSITVGGTNSDNQITFFSSAGPSYQNVRKPTISAPAQDVISAGISSDTAYASLSGTSMATPHVTGLVALLHSKRPNSTVAQIEDALIAGAQPTTPIGETCGGVPDSVYPNNHVGFGRISARVSIGAI
jgi:subtilisin family serine protease